MAEYYGVERTPEYLMHYGIRGMKWGVRKAIERGNSKALARHYRKAQNKLAKLNDKADINKQRSIAKKYGKISKISGAIGASGVGIVGGASILRKHAGHKFDEDTANLWANLHPGKNWGSYSQQRFINENQMASNMWKRYYDKQSYLNDARILSGGVGAAGLAVGAVTGAKALAAKRRASAPGHAAAVARRDEFKREMDKAFKGAKIKQKKQKTFTFKNDIKDGLRAAALSTVMGPSAAFYVQSRNAVSDIPKKEKKRK